MAQNNPPDNSDNAFEQLFGNTDLNGDCFIVGAEGERDEVVNANIVLFPENAPAAQTVQTAPDPQFTVQQMVVFVLYNTIYLVRSVNGITYNDAILLAYVRFLAARTGLISPAFNATEHHVRYNHAARLGGANNPVTFADPTVEERASFGTAIRGILTSAKRSDIRRVFSDIVCCVSYMFRVRGHHYQDSFQERYVSLWERCLHREADMVVSWQAVSTYGLHAIMPVVLDNYWKFCRDNALCAGTLIKRYDSAPAGCAGIFAVARGWNDVKILFPNIGTMIPKELNYFEGMLDQLRLPDNRWAGSINCNFYGKTRIVVDEGRIGALASSILGIYDQLAPSSQLRNSNALQRLASNAPATGGAIGMAAMRATKDERLNLLDIVPANK